MRSDESHRLFVLFTVSNERLGVDADVVLHVLRRAKITPIPRSRPEILGVATMQGRIVPILDLCVAMTLARGENDCGGRVLLLNLNGERIGVLVDDVIGVVP